MSSNRRLLNRRTSYFVDSISIGVTRIFNSVFANLFSLVEKEADVLMDKLEAKTIVIQKRITKDATSLFLVGIGMIFLIASVYYYMVESLLMTRANALLLLAILLFLLSWVARKFGGGNYDTKTYWKSQ